MRFKIAILTLSAFLITASALSAVDKLKADGYNVRLSTSSIELVFPDGSVLTTPLNFDGKNLDMLSATEGMAGELLDEAYRQLGVEKSISLPKTYSLSQNSPNPFNPATTISYSLPEGNPVHVSIRIYDLRGRLLRTLVDCVKEAGSYSIFWDGRDEKGRRLSSGIYFYRMKAGDFVQTRKMVILK